MEVHELFRPWLPFLAAARCFAPGPAVNEGAAHLLYVICSPACGELAMHKFRRPLTRLSSSASKFESEHGHKSRKQTLITNFDIQLCYNISYRLAEIALSVVFSDISHKVFVSSYGKNTQVVNGHDHKSLTSRRHGVLASLVRAGGAGRMTAPARSILAWIQPPPPHYDLRNNVSY